MRPDMGKRRRLCQKTSIQADLANCVKAYSGFDKNGGLKVREIDFVCFDDDVLRHATFSYSDGTNTRIDDFYGQKVGSVVLTDSEYIMEVTTGRAQGVDLMHVELGLSSGRREKICSPGIAADPLALNSLTVTTVRAPAGHAIIDFDALVRYHPLYTPKHDRFQMLNSFFRPAIKGWEVDQHHFKDGVICAPLCGSWVRIPELVMGTSDISELLGLGNDFAEGNLCHVLCDIGSVEAVEAMRKLASLGGGALFRQRDATGHPPVFYAVNRPRSAVDAPQCLRVLLEYAPEALQYRLPGSNDNLAHLSAQRGNPEMLDVLAECGGVASLFSEKRGSHGPPHPGDGFTPAHDAAFRAFDFIYAADSQFGHDACADECVQARADCLRVLHRRLKEHFKQALDALPDTHGPVQSYSDALRSARRGIERAVSLQERAARGITPLQVCSGLLPLLDAFHEVGGITEAEVELGQPNLRLRHDSEVLCGLLSSPKYLSLRVRQQWLQSAMDELVAPEDGEGLVLDVVDWGAPLLGACEALGVSGTDGQLTVARPARLQTVRMSSASGESAEGNGLRRQWLQSASEALLEPDHGLFVDAGNGTLLPNPHSATCVPDHLAQFALLGRIMGLALLHGEQLGKTARSLNPALLVQAFGLSFSDADVLALLDPQLAKQLQKLWEQVEAGCDLGLTFTLTDEEQPEYIGRGLRREEEVLKPQGDNETVCSRNLDEYVALRVARHVQRWRESIGHQLAALSGGLGVLLPAPLLAKVGKAMRLHELLQLLGGTPCIDDAVLEDWRKHTVYSAGLQPDDALSQWFWQVLHSFSSERRAQLLSFATGSSCPPALGFSRLPGGPFKLQRLTSSDTVPTASTCFCILRLPTCATVDALRSKLLLAMDESSGFSEAAVAAVA